MRLRRGLLLLATLVAGCGGDSEGPIRLGEMQADPRPYFYVGGSFEELELTAAGPYRGRFTNFVYGTCRASAEGGCAPPLTVQNALCGDGRINVALFGEGGGRAARAAKALRPLNRAARQAGKPIVTFDRSIRC